MGRLIDFLLSNPLVLLILVAWVAGMIGNIGKAAKKARERTERAERTERTERTPGAPARPAATRPAEPGTRSAEEVAREMRRILGLDPDEQEAAPRREPPASPARQREETPAAQPGLGSLRPRPAEVIEREVVDAERPPTPVAPRTQERRITTHIDPHVGDRIAARQSPRSGLVGKHEPAAALGSLGGRVAGSGQRRRMSQRYALDNLRKALVLNEILGKPLALRDRDDRFV